MEERRPNPDELLAQVQAEQRTAGRGRLKVFFGACAGVGKTFTMLEAARRQAAAGVDVVVGYIEPHARPETMALLEGLESLKVRNVEYRGATLTEFDLDAALTRRPALILVDELAHTNVVGSRHAKRWQDIQELLGAGIGVYTTLNVQHIETLNDIVAQFSGVRVRETVPDTVFDQADEVELVDLPPDDLLERLAEGKVYMPAQVSAAVQNFFQKRNLVALRELALRRTAERVNVQAEAYRHQGEAHDGVSAGLRWAKSVLGPAGPIGRTDGDVVSVPLAGGVGRKIRRAHKPGGPGQGLGEHANGRPARSRNRHADGIEHCPGDTRVRQGEECHQDYRR